MVAMQLTDAVVLVTGASAGIGHVAAARFAAKGAQVLVLTLYLQDVRGFSRCRDGVGKRGLGGGCAHA